MPNANIAGASQGSGDGNTNTDGDIAGDQIIVPDPNVQLGKQNANDGATNNDASSSANALGSAANGTENNAQMAHQCERA